MGILEEIWMTNVGKITVLQFVFEVKSSTSFLVFKIYSR